MAVEELFSNFGYYGPQVTRDGRSFQFKPGGPLIPIDQAFPGTDIGDIILGGRQRQFTSIDGLSGPWGTSGQPGAVAAVLGGRQMQFTSLGAVPGGEGGAAQAVGHKVPIEVTVNGRQMVYIHGEGWMTRGKFEDEFALFSRRPAAGDINNLPADVPKPGTIGGAQPAVLDRLNRMSTTEDRSKGVMEKRMKKDELELAKENAERALFGLMPMTPARVAAASASLGSIIIVILLLWFWWRS